MMTILMTMTMTMTTLTKSQLAEQRIDAMHPTFDKERDGTFQIGHIVWILVTSESYVVVAVDSISDVVVVVAAAAAGSLMTSCWPWLRLTKLPVVAVLSIKEYSCYFGIVVKRKFYVTNGKSINLLRGKIFSIIYLYLCSIRIKREIIAGRCV
jgi:hypothetical protein